MAVKATSFDIAQLAGVSQPTVSRALRGSPTVSEQTRLRIEAIAQQLNYKVDKNASNLRLQETRTLALLFFEEPTPDENGINPFFLSMLGSLTRTCAHRGYDLLISFQQLSSNWHVDYEDSRKADGIILLGYGDYELYRAKLEQLVEQGTHFVRWGFAQEGQPGTTIGCDNFRGGMDAARHLMQHGRRKIAFLGDASSHYPEFQDRYRGSCEAQGGEGIIADPKLQVDALNSQDAGYDAAELLIASGAEFDAIFAASDTIAIGAMRALRDHGLDIPTDVAIIGFDDIPAASLTHPPLTTVQQNYRLAGEVLVDGVLKQIRNEQVPTEVLPAKLIVRKSCGAH
ncbi:LacI family DNA-binding transcriptional regulator [Sphingorhabdus sp.]|uniref:LacI family DNA-binding transcriptional regulator n=1 Tax=Sphingorhabdus sp. TaxID=1902408 RepID=UPI0035947BDB